MERVRRKQAARKGFVIEDAGAAMKKSAWQKNKVGMLAGLGAFGMGSKIKVTAAEVPKAGERTAGARAAFHSSRSTASAAGAFGMSRSAAENEGAGGYSVNADEMTSISLGAGMHRSATNPKQLKVYTSTPHQNLDLIVPVCRDDINVSERLLACAFR